MRVLKIKFLETATVKCAAVGFLLYSASRLSKMWTDWPKDLFITDIITYCLLGVAVVLRFTYLVLKKDKKELKSEALFWGLFIIMFLAFYLTA